MRAYVLGDGEGEAIWFVGALMQVKAAPEQTGGAFCVLDQRVPPGYAPPRHIHHTEDEAWYVLEGDVSYFCGDRTFRAGSGSFVFLPKGVEHTFKVAESGPARLLTLTVPGSFASFVEEAGEPAGELAIPPSSPPDVERLAEVASRYQIDIVGPPPT